MLPIRRGSASVSPATIVGSGHCIGCGGCVAAGTGGAAMEFDVHGLLRPVGDREWLRRPSEVLTSICPFSPAAADEDTLAAELYPGAAIRHTAAGRFRAAYVGAVSEGDFRASGSSGGMVTWVLAELMRRGMVDGVAHVAPTIDPGEDGAFFRYRISRTAEEVRAGARSRYYPVEMSGVLREIANTPGRYAVVGIPCFIKAVQLMRRRDPIMRDRIACTLGLFCGHMKSARFVESFAWQMDVPLEDVSAVEFRAKDPARPASTYTAELTLRDGSVRRKDWWNLADGDWGAGFFQSPACDFCDDVVAEVADISFGDAWVEPYASDGRGTNVVVVRSPELQDLVDAGIREARLDLRPVDGEFVERTQAAGLRHRREGLAYRISRRGGRSAPPKRVAPRSKDVPRRRRLIYRMRGSIARWSHRMFRLARAVRRPAIYLRWARAAVAVYHGLAYSRGRIGAIVDRFHAGARGDDHR